MNSFIGLDSEQSNGIKQVLSEFTAVERALLFGSRAKGNFKNGSDIDLALTGKQLTFNDKLDISLMLEEKTFPYKIDLVLFESIKNPDLIEHINRVGIEIYSSVSA